MRSNIVTTTELTHVKWINKYILFRPHISVEYNNISFTSTEINVKILSVLGTLNYLLNRAHYCAKNRHCFNTIVYSTGMPLSV